MKSWLAALLLERTRLLLLSLASAVALWFYVGTAVKPVTETPPPTASVRLYNIDVTFAGLGEGWRAAANPTSVDVEMRWPATTVLAVRATDVQAIADVGALQPGSHRVSLRIQVPPGVTAVQATPPSVAVTLTRP